jgi:hypothetical protein
MANPTDIQKLTEQMQRAKSLIAEAAKSGEKSEVIMNNFEKTLTQFNNHSDKIAEYDAQLAAMLAVTGNGGPPLETTFPPPVDVVHTMPEVVTVTEASSVAFDVRGVAVSEVKPEG